ncbi:MAG: hypothetical protein ABMA01_14750 [Chthoniobacteraceae bacterium]
MAALNFTKKTKSLYFVFIVAVLLGCERRPNTADPVPEKRPSPKQGILPSVSSATPVSSVPRAEPLTARPKPNDDAQTSIKRVRARLEKEFESRSPEMTGIVKLHALWSETWNPSFDVPLESTSSREVADGQIVPPEVVAHINDYVLAAELFARDQVDFVSDRKEFEAAYALTVIASSVCMGSGAEIPAFLNRAGSLPPAKGDLVVFRALNDGLMFLEHPIVLNYGQFRGWQQLATASNPVYRLIAARTFHLVSSDVAQRSEVYRRLLKDSDPMIARIAVIAASRYVTDETSAALTEFRERQDRIGNTELAEAAAKALSRIEKRP